MIRKEVSPDLNCPGYPPVYVPPRVSNNPGAEVSFYLEHHKRNANGSQNLYTSKLACSLIGAFHKVASTKTGQVLGIDTSKPLIILCHGIHSWRNQLLIYHMASGLADKGFHTLRFDFEGHGHSNKENVGADLKDKFSTSTLQTIVKFVQSELHCRIHCIVGHSIGANVTMKYVEELEMKYLQGDIETETTIRLFVNLCGNFNIFNIAFDTFMQSRLMTIHGDNDTIHLVEDAYKIDDIVHKHHMEILKGANHNFNGLLHMNKMVSLIANFAEK